MRHSVKFSVTAALSLFILQPTSCRSALGDSILGDFNGSGLRDVEDVDLLHAAIGTGDLIFDLTGDAAVDFKDLEQWLERISNTFTGDVNLDGEFNASDMIIVYAANKYESNQTAKWSEGDWNGDGLFTSSDFGNFGGLATKFEQGPRQGGIDLGAPIAILGDFDGDGQFTVADVDLLSHAMIADTYNQEFDLNRNGGVDFDDRQFWVNDIALTFFGDANFDGEVGSEDWVHAFKFGKYEADDIAHWEEGDFNGDLRFDSSDFVTVFSELPDHPGPRVGHLRTVPESTPNGFVLALLIAMLWRRFEAVNSRDSKRT